MTIFHGTNQDSATKIVGPPPSIDVTKGGGELGRGFYLGDHIALAKALAVGKFNTHGVVIQFDLDNSEYVKLDTIVLKKIKDVSGLWRKLLRMKTNYQHLFGVDVVCSPFATIQMSSQYKFESLKAQDTLNHHSKIQIL